MLRFGLCLLVAGCASAPAALGSEQAALSSYSDHVAWSKKPPGLEPVDVPQFVAVTFDDNFVSGLGDVKGGMTWATTFFEPLKNPAGSGFAPTWDGTPVRTSFYDNCVYLQDDDTKKSWQTAREGGHEIANHTVNHPHGGLFSAEDWAGEIAPCTAALTNQEGGVGVSVDDVRGFRAPYLEYSSNLFAALTQQGLWYDSSIQSCWADGDDGKACAWPYTLDQGSPDAGNLTNRFKTPSVPATSGLWEATPSALFVPPDELAAQYGFEPGLRQRVPTDMAPPSFYDAATGRIAPLDVTLFVDAGLSPAEVLATLKYTLDLRLSGNRAPFIFIAHTHVYANNYGAAPKAPEAAGRQKAIEDFVHYALEKPVVRLRPVADLIDWMRHPQPLGGVITAKPAMGGAAGMAGAGGGGAGGLGGVGGAGGGAGLGGFAGTTTSAGGSAGSAKRADDAASCACHVGERNERREVGVLALGLFGVLARRRRRGAHS